MGAFGGLVLTNRGRNLQLKAQTGKPLNFTRIALGDGTLGGASILDLNALRSERKSLNITKLKILGDGKVVVGGTFSNSDITTGFYWREIGLFAMDPDIGEILYSYGNSGNNAEFIPAGGGADIVEKTIDLITIVGNAANVSATIEQSLVFAQSAFSNVKVGATTVSADSPDDTLELVAGNAVTLTPDATNDKIIIAVPNATSSAPGAMSAADKAKLDGIASGAEVNQNAFSNVKVGATTISADSKTDTLELVAGSNVTLTPDDTNDKITIAATVPVISVNGKTGAVSLTASDVGAETPAGAQAKADQAETNANAYTNKTIVENIGYGVQAGLDVTAQSPASMNVDVQAGTVYMPDGQRFEFTTATTLAVPAADATNPRKDIIYVSAAGVIEYLAGTPAATPTEPTLPTGALQLCTIDVPAGATAIEQTQITDSRVLKKDLQVLEQELAAHSAETASKFTNINLNIIDMAVELETLKGATLNGVTANIFVETFTNLNDINLMNGIYDSTNKRLVL